MNSTYIVVNGFLWLVSWATAKFIESNKLKGCVRFIQTPQCQYIYGRKCMGLPPHRNLCVAHFNAHTTRNNVKRLFFGVECSRTFILNTLHPMVYTIRAKNSSEEISLADKIKQAISIVSVSLWICHMNKHSKVLDGIDCYYYYSGIYLVKIFVETML